MPVRLEREGIPLSGSSEVRLGSRLRIPCRTCGKSVNPFTVEVGQHDMGCSECGSKTTVTVKWVGGSLRIWTRRKN
jgi:hypothetical protein